MQTATNNHSNGQIQRWRARSLDLIFRSLFVFLLFAIILPIHIAMEIQAYWRMVMFALTLALAALATFHQGLPYRVKASLLLLILYAQGIQGFFMSAGAGDAFMFMIVIPFVGGLFLGTRISIKLLIIAVLTMMSFGALFVLGILVPENEFAVPAARNLMSWASRIPVFIVLVLLLVLPQGWLIKKLSSALDAAQENESKQRALAESIRESEQKFRAIFEQAFQFVGLLKPDGSIVSANQTALRFLDLSEDEVVGKQLWDTPWFRHSEKEREKIRQSVQKAALGEKVRHFTTHQDLEEKIHHIDFSLIPILDDNDQVTWILPEGRDITDIKNLQEAVRHSESRFRSYFDSNPDGIFLFDLDGKVIEVNRTLLRMTGYRKEELVGKHFSEITSSEYVEKLSAQFTETKFGITGNKPFQMGFAIKNGTEIFISIQGWLVTDPNSQPVAVGVFVKDVSVEKQLMEEKVHLEQQLQHAQRMEAIGTLAGGIAHDFNNILSGIMGYTELAIDDVPKGSITRERLSHVLEAGGRASDLVNQILQFSRKEAHILAPISLRSLLKEAVKLTRSTLPSTIEIRQEIDVEQDRIMADATKLHQVIMNLCTNAYQAMRHDGGVLIIKLQNVHLSAPRQSMSVQIPPGEYLKLSVSDTGHGIPPEARDRIFEPYFTTKKSEGGTGLGLAVSFGIIQDHQGLIEVDQNVEVGTTIAIYLPITQHLESDTEAEKVVYPKGNGERILVVDDEAFFLDVVRQHLTDLGYRPSGFQNSTDALAAVSADPDGFELLITDLTMPAMTGIQLAAAVRKINKTVPIILCTGFSETLTEQSAAHYGIRKILSKPVKRSVLAEAVYATFQE